MTAWNYQRGDVPVGCLIGFVVLVLVAIFAMNMIPAQIRLGELEKRIEELADRANRREYTNQKIKEEILEKAEEVNLDILEKNIEISRNNKWIKIHVSFEQTIRFPGYVWVRHHEYDLDRPIL